MENDMEMAGEIQTDIDKGLDKRRSVDKGINGEHNRRNERGRKYSKEATVIIDLEGVQDGKAEDIIKMVTEKIGGGHILAVRPRLGREYEITLRNEDMCDILLDGITIKGKDCVIRKLQTREYVVSFMHLPAYLEDKDIFNKLDNWGVHPTSQIKRRLYPGTEVEDGTRFVRVKFPDQVVSLPYSTKFETAEGTQFFRIIHDRQVKTCRMCLNPGHILRDCPDFKCHLCEEQGHFARDCDAVRCPDCHKVLVKCECWMVNEERPNKETDSEVECRQIHKEVEEEEKNYGGEQAEVEREEETNGTQREKEEQMMEEERTLEETSLKGRELEHKKEQEESEQEEDEKETEKQKSEGYKRDREFTRMQRRSLLKVKPNIDCARKRKEKMKEKATFRGKCEVLRSILEEEEEK